VRSLAASPYGLFIGGTHFLIGYTGEVRGASVWLGSPAADAVAPVTTLTTPPSPNEGDTLSTRTATFAWTGSDTPAGGSLPLTYAYRLDPIEPAFSAFGSATTKSYSSLLNGTYTFFVIAKDASGNTEAAGAAPGAANRRTFTISAPDLPPTVSITVAPSSPSTSANASFAWSGSDDVTPPASLTYDRWLSPPQADPGTFTPGTTANYTGLTDGSYTFHVIAKDGAGNSQHRGDGELHRRHPACAAVFTFAGERRFDRPAHGAGDVGQRCERDGLQRRALPCQPVVHLRAGGVESTGGHDDLRRHDHGGEPGGTVQLSRTGVQRDGLLGLGHCAQCKRAVVHI
jgi:hypothetical protein